MATDLWAAVRDIRTQVALSPGLSSVLVATTLCGFASDLTSLIVFRVLQGIGGSALGANSIAILIKAVDQDRRGRALGFFAAAQAIGMCAGPAIGGLVLGTLGWHWVFWISVPFGLIAFVIGWLILPRTAANARDKSFDWHGALLLGPALVLFVLVLNQLSAWGAASPATIGCGTAAAFLIWLLVRQERISRAPLVDLRLFRSMAFCCGVVAVVIGYAMLYGMFFLMSFALEHGHGDTSAGGGPSPGGHPGGARNCRTVWRRAQRPAGTTPPQRCGNGGVRCGARHSRHL